jgi:hypothetical protein
MPQRTIVGATTIHNNGTTTTATYKWYNKSPMTQMMPIPSWQGKQATAIDKRVVRWHGLIDDVD